nr:MAG TPA: hypothetical protein [Caudoviricetes sp.]
MPCLYQLPIPQRRCIIAVMVAVAIIHEGIIGLLLDFKYQWLPNIRNNRID